MAASEAAKEAVCLKRFATELDSACVASTVPLSADNQAAIDLAYNPEHHQRTKHIDRRHFFVRDCVENMQISVPYVGTADNQADFFTKPLASKKFFAMRQLIVNENRVAGPALPPSG